MKQKSHYEIVINLLALSILSNISNKAYAIEERVENLPVTTVKQWQSQLNNSVAFITNIKVRSASAGIEVVLNTVNGQTLQQIISTKRNNLIIDLTNATLQLPESRFIQLNPIAGISEVRAIALLSFKYLSRNSPSVSR